MPKCMAQILYQLPNLFMSPVVSTQTLMQIILVIKHKDKIIYIKSYEILTWFN